MTTYQLQPPHPASSIENPVSSIENRESPIPPIKYSMPNTRCEIPDTSHERRVKYEMRDTRYESRATSHGSRLNMQNKPNFPAPRMNLTSAKTMTYEQMTMNNASKNKPNQTQFRPPLDLIDWTTPNSLIHRKRFDTLPQVAKIPSFLWRTGVLYEEFYGQKGPMRSQMAAGRC
jgi:hypothetical protein